MSDAAILTQDAPVTFDVERIRADFPILSREVYGKPLVYLDNGASAQKPKAVIDAMRARGAEVPIPTDVVTATAFSADAAATSAAGINRIRISTRSPSATALSRSSGR